MLAVCIQTPIVRTTILSQNTVLLLSKADINAI